MLSSNDVDAIIFAAITALNAERSEDEQIPLSSTTPLFGVDSAIDSLGFVSVITDVETTLNMEHGMDIALADDRAMSRPESPYRSVETLRDYVLELIEDR
jgi:acyl carrier protein